MALGETATRLQTGEHIERNLLAARTGARFTYRPVQTECANCGLDVAAHHRETGILFCPEWALRDMWGK